MQLSEFIDHTLLKPTAKESQIRLLCKEAITYNFRTVCINGCWVALAAELLQNSKVEIATVVGFPLGAMSTEAKVAETKEALMNGADEVDMVMNLGWLKAKDYKNVQNEISRVKKVMGSKILKVIIETCYLTNEEKEKACELAIAANADYIKTSTGFGPEGATFTDVQLLKKTVGDNALIKASGGVRDKATALTFIEMGVSRIGTSSGILLVSE